MRENFRKNTVGRNEFTDFEKFEVEHSENVKTILATTSPNHPGDGITLRQNRSTSDIPSIWGTRARSERPPAGPEKYTEVPGNDKSNQNFRFLRSSKNVIFSKICSHMTSWHRSLFILSSGVAHLFRDMTPPIESHMREKHGKNTVGQNEFTDFEKIELEHPENTKTILATTSANHPGEGVTLRQNRSTSHIPSIWGTRARSERPPAGPKKYMEVLGNDKPNQNFRFLTSSKNADFSIRKSRISSHGTH